MRRRDGQICCLWSAVVVLGWLSWGLRASSAEIRFDELEVLIESESEWTDGGDGGAPVQALQLMAGDLDGDDDMDVFLVTDDGVGYWANQEEGRFSSLVKLAENRSVANNGAHALADIDGDGDLDYVGVLSGERREEGGVDFPSSLLWLENDGLGRFGEPHLVEAINDHVFLQVADLNRDGLPEICWAVTRRASVKLHINQAQEGPGRFLSTVLVQGFSSNIDSFRLADVSGDGNLDLITSSGFGLSDVHLQVSDLRFKPVTAPAVHWPSDPRYGYVMVDLDNDAKADLVGPSQNDFGIGWSVFPFEESQPLVEAGPADAAQAFLHLTKAVDFDGDQDLDFLFGFSFFVEGAPESRVLHVAESSFPEKLLLQPTAIPYGPESRASYPASLVEVADVTGDGRADILQIDQEAGQIVMVKNETVDEGAPRITEFQVESTEGTSEMLAFGHELDFIWAVEGSADSIVIEPWIGSVGGVRHRDMVTIAQAFGEGDGPMALEKEITFTLTVTNAFGEAVKSRTVSLRRLPDIHGLTLTNPYFLPGEPVLVEWSTLTPDAEFSIEPPPRIQAGTCALVYPQETGVINVTALLGGFDRSLSANVARESGLEGLRNERLIARTELYHPGATAIVDLDSDGDLDILVESRHTIKRLHLYENLGGGRFADVKVIDRSEKGSHQYAKLILTGDVNRDERVDVVYFTGDETKVLLQDEDGGFRRFAMLENWQEPDTGWLLDLDSDGYMDIATNENLWWKQLSRGSFAERHYFFEETSPPFDEALIDDLDRDGVLDLVVWIYGDGVVWYEAVNPAYEWREVLKMNVRVGTGTPFRLVDLDANGLADILIGSSAFMQRERRVFEQVVVPRRERVELFVDLNGDGLTDRINGGYAVRFDIQDPVSAQLEPVSAIGEDWGHVASLDLRDLDGDGIDDLIVAWNDHNRLYWHRGKPLREGALMTFGEGASIIAHPPATDPSGLAASDFDGDGRPDIALSGRQLWWYRNGSNEQFTGSELRTETSWLRSVRAGDLDGDGDLDLMYNSTIEPRLAWSAFDRGKRSFSPEAFITREIVGRIEFIDDLGSGVPAIGAQDGQDGAILMFGTPNAPVGSLIRLPNARTYDFVEFTGDGLAKVALIDRAGMAVHSIADGQLVMPALGEMGFSEEVTGMKFLELNDDGRKDALLWWFDDSRHLKLGTALQGESDYRFEPIRNLEMGRSLRRVVDAVSEDFDHNGSVDLAIAVEDDDGHGFLDIISMDGLFHRATLSQGTWKPRQYDYTAHVMAPEDFDGDGQIDLALTVDASVLWFRNETDTYLSGENGPVIKRFEADKETFETDQPVRIHWEVEGAESIRLSVDPSVDQPAIHSLEWHLDKPIFMLSLEARNSEGLTRKHVILHADEDDDRLPDWWEAQYFSDMTVADGAGDFDGDGASNEKEYRESTDPTDGGFQFAIRLIERVAGGLRLEWSSRDGSRYGIESSVDLREWRELEMIVEAAEASSTTVWVPEDKVGDSQFLRVKLIP